MKGKFLIAWHTLKAALRGITVKEVTVGPNGETVVEAVPLDTVIVQRAVYYVLVALSVAVALVPIGDSDINLGIADALSRFAHAL